MQKKFIIAVKEHALLGNIITSYVLTEDEKEHYYKIAESIVPENIAKDEHLYPEPIKKIVKLCDEFSEKNIAKTYDKKKRKNINEFFKSIDNEFVILYLRPFIEKRLFKIIEIATQNNISIFIKADKYDTIYPEDEIINLKTHANTVFNFIKESTESKYFISVKYRNNETKLLNKNAVFLVNEPCIAIIDNKLFHFNDIDSKKLLPFLKKPFVTIPKSAEKKYFETFVKSSIEKYKVNAQGFDIKVLDPHKQARLVLENDWKNEFTFILNFIYNDVAFLATSKNKVIVTLDYVDNNYAFTKLERDFEWEQNIENKLNDIFSVKENEGNYKIVTKSFDANLQRSFTINWLNENKEKLIDAGVSVEQNLYKKEYYTGKIHLTLGIKTQKDWFDIYAMVKLDIYEIPFIKFKHHILNNIREFELPDKKIAILPEEWFVKYTDLFAFGNITSDDTIRIRTYHYQSLLFYEQNDDTKKRLSELSVELANASVQNKIIPNTIIAKLRNYQIEGYNWLMIMQKYSFGACLADDMGLGKTLQTITLLSETKFHKPINLNQSYKTIEQQTITSGNLNTIEETEHHPHLIIVPKSLIYNWKNEIKRFAPQLTVLDYTGLNRALLRQHFYKNDIIITSYGIIRNEIDLLSGYLFNLLVLDESQVIKNPDSKIYQAILHLKAKNKLALTGTPLENSLEDLWAQFNVLNPGLLGNLSFFRRKFINPIEKGEHPEIQDKLKKLIQPFILRRTKQQVLTDLPELIEQTIYCELSEEQDQVYKNEKSAVRNAMLQIIDSGVYINSAIVVLQSLTKLRQIASHPFMVDNSYTGDSGKMEEVLRILESILAENHKVLIFSSFVKHLNLVADKLKKQQIDFALLTGATHNREQEVSKFQNNDEIQVFLVSIKAGGIGLNLTAADYVFILDPWWNPAVENQAISRSHRMGQKNNVMVYRFISKDTIEEKIQKLQTEKAELADIFVNTNNPFEKINQETVLELLE